jgi:hypothetical protein
LQDARGFDGRDGYQSIRTGLSAPDFLLRIEPAAAARRDQQLADRPVATASRQPPSDGAHSGCGPFPARMRRRGRDWCRRGRLSHDECGRASHADDGGLAKCALLRGIPRGVRRNHATQPMLADGVRTLLTAEA